MLAAQLYTVRDFCQKPDDLTASLIKLRKIGYRAVQVSGIPSIPAKEIKRCCDTQGMVICATHENPATITDSPQQVVDRLGELGCTATAYPWPHRGFGQGMADVEALAKDLDRAGEVLRRAGQTLCYHNHHLEFRRLNGRTILDWLFHLTAPANLQGEPDTYWVAHGGQDPAAWCQKLTGRLPLLHLKDFVINDQNTITMAEIGNGNLDWPVIVAAARAAGCRWFIVEQDTCPGDPFDSLAISFRHCTTVLGLGA